MKYIIAIKVDNKAEIFEFDNKEDRSNFFKSIDGNIHIKDVAFSEYNNQIHSNFDKSVESKNNKKLIEYKTKEIDPMYNFIQFLFIILVMVHSWYGNDVFPILCLICLNAIADRYFNWRSK